MKNLFYNICIIGAGGTGGNFTARLAQFISTGNYPAEIVLVDGDSVEESNISRQPFSKDELLLNKAVALSSAIEENYGLNVKAYPHYIDTVNDLSKIFRIFQKQKYGYTFINILIGCCDNHRCRQVMEQFFDQQDNLIYIDSANEFSSGEVVVGLKLKGKVISPSRKFYFPEIMLSTEKSKSEESCGAVNIHKPQHLATNCFASNVLLTVVSKLIADGKIDCGIILFDTFNYTCVFRTYENKEVSNAKI